MKVYRIISESSNQPFKNIKNKYNLLNTHHYDTTREYVHFFRYGAFANYFYKLNEGYGKIMIADISKEILDKYKGFGLYVYEGELTPIPEYAIPKDEFDIKDILLLTQNLSVLPEIENDEIEFKHYLELVNKLKEEKKNVDTIITILSKIEDLDSLHINNASIDNDVKRK